MVTLDELKEVIELAKELPGATFVFNINVGSSSTDSGGDDSGGDSGGSDGKKYKVTTGDKPNKKAKVRSTPDASISEFAFVYDGDIVTGTGLTHKGFIQIVEPNGWVESQYLVAI